MSVTVPLTKPVTAHGSEVSELVLREPTADDVMQIGSPTLLVPGADGDSVSIEIRAKVIGQYVMRLGSIPLSSVKGLSVADFQRCQGAVMGFFSDGGGETAATSPTPSST